MDTVVVAARLGLAAVLVTAGVAKLVDLGSFAEANRRLGISERFVPALRTVVPALELVLAVGLLVTVTAPAAAVVTILLFAAFTALLMRNLARGNRPACNCFGSSQGAPISWRAVVRNVGLGAAALLAVGSGDEGIPAWLSSQMDQTAMERWAAVLAACLVLGGAAALALLREGWRPEPRRSAAPEGHRGLAPGTDVSEVVRTIGSTCHLAGELPIVVIHTDPECGPCRALLPRVLSWQSAYAGIVEIVVVTGHVDDHEHYDEVTHLVAGGESIAERLQLQATPSAVLVDRNGTVASPVAEGAIQVGALVSEAALVDGVSHLVQGDPAGGVVLSTGGGLVSIADLQGAMTLVLFWDPWCGFCKQALLPLLQWQESIRSTGQRLLVAGQRDDEVAGLQGFDLVGADADGAVMRLFGGEGTPSAVLVDAAGRVASDVAHGLDEVMALAARSDLLTSLGAPTRT